MFNKDEALAATGKAADGGESMADKYMTDKQKKQMKQAKAGYKSAAITSKLMTENKGAVQWMGNLTGKGEETKQMLETAALVNSGCQAVDKAQKNIADATTRVNEKASAPTSTPAQDDFKWEEEPVSSNTGSDPSWGTKEEDPFAEASYSSSQPNTPYVPGYL